jgi:hypothetical protein
MTNELVTITLSRDDLGQIIDGLCCREDAYRKTAECLKTGQMAADFIVEEVSDAAEAGNLAEIYSDIINTLRQQMKNAKAKT